MGANTDVDEDLDEEKNVIPIKCKNRQCFKNLIIVILFYELNHSKSLKDILTC